MKQWISRLGSLLVLSAAACGTGEKVDIGDDGPIETLGSKLSDYSGRWTGYAEAYKFNDDSDQVRIVLDGAGNGSIKFGSAEWPVPDPVGPAPGPKVDGDGNPYRTDRVEAGFAFPVHSADVTDNRIRFFTKNMEAYEDYCAVHTPTHWPNGLYLCYAPIAGPSACRGGQELDAPNADCAAATCGEVCTCTADACTVNLGNIQPSVDAVLSEDGHVLVGTLVIGAARITIRLKHE